MLDTVKTYCETKLHQFSKITAISVDTIIAIPFSQSCQIDISSIMTVRFFALQKYSVRLSIYCDVKDIDNLSAAGANITSISVNYDDILDNDKTVKQHTAKQRSSSDDNANKEISNVLIDWGLDMIPGLGMFKGVIKKMLKTR